MNADEIIEIFNSEFAGSMQTVIARSSGDPLYVPASESDPYHKILFAHGFYASALHEISHWCIAGRERLKLADFGYWYKPDGRNALEQADFEAFEAKPQALEWIFSSAVGLKFHVSFDNLNASPHDVLKFRRKVFEEAKAFMTTRGLPPRARSLLERLFDHYNSRSRFAAYWQDALANEPLPD